MFIFVFLVGSKSFINLTVLEERQRTMTISQNTKAQPGWALVKKGSLQQGQKSLSSFLTPNSMVKSGPIFHYDYSLPWEFDQVFSEKNFYLRHSATTYAL